MESSNNMGKTDLRQECFFEYPKWQTRISGWEEHVPFAFALVKILSPKTYVELGVQYGVSYFAFCQAVKKMGCATKCFGIDTWQGDKHTGLYNEKVYGDVSRHNTENYREFSSLMKCYFEDALPKFKDKSIDLLHIDGLHTYEAVKHDFETWLPKMSDKGVVIFHDTTVKRNDFGVWKLWDQIKDKYPSFNFSHNYGLGVLAVGKNAGADLLDLIGDLNNDPSYRKMFARLGADVLKAAKRNEKINYEELPDVRICVYTFCYNEEKILPFFLRHYLSFCDEVVVYDNGSTDNSAKIINSFKNTRIVKYNPGELRDDLHVVMKNNIWKEARGRFDFVIVVDADEFIYYPDMKKLLAYCKKNGKTVLHQKGYEMVGESDPGSEGMLNDRIKKGVYNRLYDKKVVFDPNKIREMNYTPGAHKAVPRGRVRYFRSPDLKLLHYKFLSKERYLDKVANVRQSDENRKKNYGITADLPEEFHKNLYEDMLKKSTTVLL